MELQNKKSISYSEAQDLIPHITLDKIKGCEHILPEDLSTINFFSSFQHYQRFRLGDEKNLLSNLKLMSNISSGTHMAHFIADYWGNGCYNWYKSIDKQFNRTFIEIKESLRETPETNFLTMIQGNISRFEKEIKSILSGMPIDLIKIIYSYGYSAADIMGKIISVVQCDILKYGAIIAAG